MKYLLVALLFISTRSFAQTPARHVAAPMWGTPDTPAPEMVVRPYLRKHLNDWGSYDGMGYSKPDAVAVHNGVPAWRVRHTYRAKNGFGGTVLNDQMFYYTAAGVYLVLEAR